MLVECRDGVKARVQRVPYEGAGGGEVLFGRRMNPHMPAFDEAGMRNESGDIWRLDGYWRENATRHPFDLIYLLAGVMPQTQAQSHGY